MIVRLLRPWKTWRVGKIFNLDDGVGNMLIKRGTGEQVKQEQKTKTEKPKRVRD